MRVVGVLDLMGGVVVRGIAGRREEYRPIRSQLCATAEPVAVAQALVQTFGLRELYVADLDAIAGAEPAWEVYRALRRLGVALWIDAGVRSVVEGLRLAEYGSAVVGLETVAGPDVVEALARQLPDQVVFSLDLRAGRPLAWGESSEAIVEEVVRRGVRRLLTLDLSRVGVGQGTGTETLCAWIAQRHPQVELSAGGGVQGRADLDRLRACGVQAVLVASALHDGRLTAADLRF
ncbi:MAG: HisA/HisF-related TIM barrel protein [Gemmataceae bacterium]